MAKEISEEKMDELMKILTEGLNGVFDGVADVKCIKGNTDELFGKFMSTYMKFPIIKVEASREGSDVSVNQCSIDDVIEALPNIIGNLLGLIPEKYRNEVLYKAINDTKMTKNGGLRDRILEKEENHEYNEEEDDE